MRALCAAAVALAAAGCVPLPYASPPAQVHVGGGGTAAGQGAGVLRVQADVAPLGLFGDPTRPWDLRAGYLYEATSDERRGRHGAALAGDWYVLHPARGEGGHRLGVTTQGVYRGDGAGVDLGLSWMYFQRVGTPFANLGLGDDDEPSFQDRGLYERDDPNTDSRFRRTQRDNDRVGIVGVATGELGVGLRVSGGVRQLGDGDPEWLVVGGLDVRLPASLGVLLLWLFD